MMKNINLTWEDIFARINYIKKKHKITPKTKVFGVPKNGMILAGFLGAVNAVSYTHLTLTTTPYV